MRRPIEVIAWGREGNGERAAQMRGRGMTGELLGPLLPYSIMRACPDIHRFFHARLEPVQKSDLTAITGPSIVARLCHRRSTQAAERMTR